MTLESGSFLQKEGVYDHIGKIVNRVIAEKPKDAYGLVEVLSRLVKQPQPVSPDAEANEEELATLVEHVKKARLLDRPPMGEDGGEPAEVPCAVPDVVEEAEMFSWAGVGLGEAESYKILCSIRNMASKQEGGYSKMRFWGKILGAEADYYVVEAAREGGDAEEGEDMDPPGTGVNAFTYFVTTDLAGSWVKLPDTKTRDIVSARLVKRIFSGKPQAKVVTHPFFDGKEEVLLRAQIARISADCTLCIKGAFVREDPEDPNSGIVKPEEGFVMPSLAELVEPGAWMHMAPHILNNGRTAHKELPDEEEDPAAFKAAKEEIENDPPKDTLRGLVDDGLKWVIKQAGDPTMYKSPIDGKPISNAVTYVRSLTWPGAVTVAQKESYTNIYIGYGVRAGEPDFFPPAPPDVQDEPEDPGEAEEPQGEEEEVPEGATDE